MGQSIQEWSKALKKDNKWKKLEIVKRKKTEVERNIESHRKKQPPEVLRKKRRS